MDVYTPSTLLGSSNQCYSVYSSIVLTSNVELFPQTAIVVLVHLCVCDVIAQTYQTPAELEFRLKEEKNKKKKTGEMIISLAFGFLAVANDLDFCD